MKLYIRDGVWHFRLYFRGREYRRSAYTKSEKQAQRVAEQFQRALILGQYAPEAQDITYEQAAERLVREYQQQGRRSMRALQARLKHLRWFAGRRLGEITADLISRYVSMRLDRHAAAATVNREQAALSAIFRAAGIPRPKLVRLAENNARQGFVDWGDFLRIRSEIPAELQGLVTTCYVTGWRFSSVANLQWRDVDDHAIRVRPEHSKNKQGLEFPLNDILREVLTDAQAHRHFRIWPPRQRRAHTSNQSLKEADNASIHEEINDHVQPRRMPSSATVRGVQRPGRFSGVLLPVPRIGTSSQTSASGAGPGTGGGTGRGAGERLSSYVFHHAGKPWRDIRISWRAACRRAGFPGLLIHDLCRSAVRNMVRTPGITEHMAMQLVGRKTRSILYRYDIISHEDRAMAAERLNAYLAEQPASKVRKIR